MVKLFLLPVIFGAMTVAAAETRENFNSRKGIAITHLKAKLQNSCWTFHNFDINSNGWNPGIEGDGAMVAGAEAIRFNYSGIYTPMLRVASEMQVSFDYVFNTKFSETSKRWVKIALANANNDIIQVLEEVRFSGADATTPKKFSTQFKNIPSGEYRVVLQYGGNGETARIAVDQLQISAPLVYEGGCNVTPVQLTSKVTGRPDRSAFGTLLLNENGKKDAKLAAYLIKNSPDGQVQLNADGTFVFTPQQGFEGTSTSFVYKVCDDGAGYLCSANTTVHISFPKASVSLVDFKGSYKYNGNVELMWNTTAVNSTEKFELERSFNGRDWQNAGVIKKDPAVNVYAYVDFVGRGTAHKKDIYYRLKQTNTDGDALYSRLLIVRVYNSKTLTMISVTPNPMRNDITANVQLLEDSYVSMRVLDDQGTSVLHSLKEGTAGLNTFAVEGSSKLKPGAYILELIVNSRERMLVKLLKE